MAATGTLQKVLTCVDRASGIPPNWMQQACPAYVKNGVVTYQNVVSVDAYLLDPAAQATIEGALGPFDYVYAAGLWSLAFTFVVGLFLIARSAGTILNFIRGRS